MKSLHLFQKTIREFEWNFAQQNDFHYIADCVGCLSSEVGCVNCGRLAWDVLC